MNNPIWQQILSELYNSEYNQQQVYTYLIIKKLNINKDSGYKIIWELEDKNLIEKINCKGKKIIKLTNEGKKFAELFFETQQFLNKIK